ncbi:hypothetical protein F4802DRAFT_561934 [Xylaria palmicola]|nr:hypothetical protein F4802DRAFT_561934 [Xylaria palmicola]
MLVYLIQYAVPMWASGPVVVGGIILASTSYLMFQVYQVGMWTYRHDHSWTKVYGLCRSAHLAEDTYCPDKKKQQQAQEKAPNRRATIPTYSLGMVYGGVFFLWLQGELLLRHLC